MWGNGTGYGMGFGMGWGMWILMVVGVIGFWLLVAYLVRTVIQGRPGTRTPPDSTGPEPLRLLDERLARGVIELEEYQRIRNGLTQTR